MRLPRPTYSNVTASLALFVALGGTSYAITKLPKDSVGSQQVRDGSLRAKDLGAGVVPVPVRGPRGSEGPRGAQGERGLQGANGERGPSDARFAASSAVIDLPFGANGVAVVGKLTSLESGRWLVMFSAELNWEDSGAQGVTCRALVNGATVATTSAYVGANGSTRNLPLAGFGVIDRASLVDPFDVVLECEHDAGFTSDRAAVKVQTRSMAAVRVDSLMIG
jgi:hypothetical protein